MKTIMQFMVSSILKLVASFLLAAGVWVCVNFYYLWDERRHIVPVIEKEEGELDRTLLATRIIEMEVEAGIAMEPERAKRILASLLEEAKSIKAPEIPTTITVRAYLGEIGKVVGRHFIYQKSTIFTEGLILGVLDCDLRSLVYQSIAKQAGLDVSIIYSPNHAFIGWRSPGNGLSLYWETTTRFGEAASLGRSMYRDSNDPAEFAFRTEEESEDLYGSWIYGEAFDRHRKEENLVKVLELASAYPGWGYPQMAKLHSLYKAYGFGDQRTKDQLAVYLALDGDQAFGKRMKMESHKYDGAKERGMEIFKSIRDRELLPEDFQFASELSSSAFERFKFEAVSKVYGVLNDGNLTLFGKTLSWVQLQILFVSAMGLSMLWIICSGCICIYRRHK